MAEMTFNSIFDAVSLALHAAYPEAQIHGGGVKQGLKNGDFNVIMPAASHEKELGARYKRTPELDIIYYPKEDPCMAECCDIASELTLILESITTPGGDIVHASGISWQVQDDVLHYSVEYPHIVYIPQEFDDMDTLTLEQEVNN